MSLITDPYLSCQVVLEYSGFPPAFWSRTSSYILTLTSPGSLCCVGSLQGHSTTIPWSQPSHNELHLLQSCTSLTHVQNSPIKLIWHPPFVVFSCCQILRRNSNGFLSRHFSFVVIFQCLFTCVLMCKLIWFHNTKTLVNDIWILFQWKTCGFACALYAYIDPPCNPRGACVFGLHYENTSFCIHLLPAWLQDRITVIGQGCFKVLSWLW